MANIAAVTLTGVVFGSIESVTVELAVAQPLRISTGLQDGFNLSHAQDAAAYGAAFGGALGAGAGTVRAASDAGGFVKMFEGIPINVRGPELAYPNGHLLLRQGDYNAWPRSKRKGATQPKYRADLAGDEGKKNAHTLDRHTEKTDRDLRSRLREDRNITGSSSFLDEASAQRFVDEAMLQKQSEVKRWLENTTSAQKIIQARFDEVTGRSLSREDFIRGTGPHDVQGVKLIIRRDPDMPNGYRIHTAYPTS